MFHHDNAAVFLMLLKRATKEYFLSMSLKHNILNKSDTIHQYLNVQLGYQDVKRYIQRKKCINIK